MKKVLFLICESLLILIGVLFFAVLNLKLAALGPEKMKNIAEESGFYNVAASYIRNEIVSSSGISINDDASFNKLNNAISTESVRETVDKAIDDVFAAIDNSSSSRVIPVSFTTSEIDGASFSFEKKINLNSSPFFIVLQNYDKILIALFIIVLLLYIFALFLGENGVAKLRIVAVLSWTISVFLLIFWAFEDCFLPNRIDALVSKSNFFSEAKLVSGLDKIFSAVLSHQNIYFGIELVALILFGFVCNLIAKSTKKENLGLIEEKI